MNKKTQKTIAVFSNVTTGKFLHHTQTINKYNEIGVHDNDQSRYNE